MAWLGRPRQRGAQLLHHRLDVVTGLEGIPELPLQPRPLDEIPTLEPEHRDRQG